MHSKYQCHERAKSLIAEGTGVSLRYAALELRFCMEAITYEKLEASAKHIPPHVLETWQPPQAVKMLLEHEPKADKGFVLFAGIEKEYGKPSDDMQFVGEHKAFKLGWLRKHYNKVGSYLHYSHGSKRNNQESIDSIRKYLQEVCDEVEEVLKGNILGGWLDQVFEYTCEKCQQVILVGKHTLENTSHIICQNPNCKAEYFTQVEGEGEKVRFTLKVTQFDCAKCKAKISVENRKLDIGFEFRCPACSTKHRIENRQWGYSAEIETNES